MAVTKISILDPAALPFAPTDAEMSYYLQSANPTMLLMFILAQLAGTAAAGGGGAVTIANGADAAEGSTTDAAVAAGAPGSVSSKLRRLTADLAAFIAANHTDLAAVATEQDAGNASLASIDTKQTTEISHLSDISNALSGEVVANYLAIGASDSQVIPAHSKGYGFAFFTGTGTVNGQAVVAGYAVSEEKANNVAITIATGADSSGIIRWNT